MQSLILTLHIIVCVLLVILVLLQSGKEGMGVIFGGGNSSVFGSAGAGGILAKLTTLMAIIFIITSLSYTYVTSTRPAAESVILDVHIEEPGKPETNSSPGHDTPVSKEQSETTKPINDQAGAIAPKEDSNATQDNGASTSTEPQTETPEAKK